MLPNLARALRWHVASVAGLAPTPSRGSRSVQNSDKRDEFQGRRRQEHSITTTCSCWTGGVLEDRYSLLTADPDAFAWITNDRIQVVGLPKRYGDTIFSPLVHEFLLDRILKRYQIDLVFNLADLVVRTKVMQVYLFDWPYAINPNSVVWQRMGRRDSARSQDKTLSSQETNSPARRHDRPDAGCQGRVGAALLSAERRDRAQRGIVGQSRYHRREALCPAGGKEAALPDVLLSP